MPVERAIRFAKERKELFDDLLNNILKVGKKHNTFYHNDVDNDDVKKQLLELIEPIQKYYLSSECQTLMKTQEKNKWFSIIKFLAKKNNCAMFKNGNKKNIQYAIISID